MAYHSARRLALVLIFVWSAGNGAQAGPVSEGGMGADAPPGFAMAVVPAQTAPDIDTEATASPGLFSWAGAAAFSGASGGTEPPQVVSLADPSSATLLGGALLAVSASAGLRRRR